MKKIDFSGLRIFKSPENYKLFEKMLVKIDYKKEKISSLYELINLKYYKKKQFSIKKTWNIITKAISTTIYLNKDYQQTTKEESHIKTNLFAYKYIYNFCKIMMIKINIISIQNRVNLRRIRNEYLNLCLTECEKIAKRSLKSKEHLRYHELIKRIISQSKKEKNKIETSVFVTNNFKVLIGKRESIIKKKIQFNLMEHLHFVKKKEIENLSEEQKEINFITENNLPKGHFTEKFIGPTDVDGVYQKYLDIQSNNLKKKIKINKKKKRKLYISPLQNSNSSSQQKSFPVLTTCFSSDTFRKKKPTFSNNNITNLIRIKKKSGNINYSLNKSNVKSFDNKNDKINIYKNINNCQNKNNIKSFFIRHNKIGIYNNINYNLSKSNIKSFDNKNDKIDIYKNNNKSRSKSNIKSFDNKHNKIDISYSKNDIGISKIDIYRKCFSSRKNEVRKKNLLSNKFLFSKSDMFY